MSNTPVNIICLKWGNKYPAEYVNRLYRMVKKNITLPFRFVCLTEDTEGVHPDIEILPIEIDPELHGWWYKLQLFKSELYDLSGPTLFLDLDVVIVANIDDMFLYAPQKFCIINDLQKGKVYNSSVFRLNIGSYANVWESFAADKKGITERLHGDQDWISEEITDASIWPKEWVVSFKKQCNARSNRSWGIIGHFLRKNGFLKTTGEASIPPQAKIVYFHGKPDPCDVADAPYDMWRIAPWINDAWKG